MPNPHTLLFPPSGMPSIPRKGPPDLRESVRVSSELMEKARGIAKREGRMVAWVVDRLIRLGMKAEAEGFK